MKKKNNKTNSESSDSSDLNKEVLKHTTGSSHLPAEDLAAALAKLREEERNDAVLDQQSFLVRYRRVQRMKEAIRIGLPAHLGMKDRDFVDEHFENGGYYVYRRHQVVANVINTLADLGLPLPHNEYQARVLKPRLKNKDAKQIKALIERLVSENGGVLPPANKIELLDPKPGKKPESTSAPQTASDVIVPIDSLDPLALIDHLITAPGLSKNEVKYLHGIKNRLQGSAGEAKDESENMSIDFSPKEKSA